MFKYLSSIYSVLGATGNKKKWIKHNFLEGKNYELRRKDKLGTGIALIQRKL